MNTKTVGDILTQIIELERALQQRYADIRDLTGDNGAKLLSYYLGRKRRGTEDALGRLNETSRERVTMSPAPNGLHFASEQAAPILDCVPTDIQGSTLLQYALAYQASLEELCLEVLEHELMPEVEDFFRDLHRSQKRELAVLAKMRDMDYF